LLLKVKNTVEKIITKSFKRLLDKGIHRGFITHEELGRSLGKRHFNQDNVETAFMHIFDNRVCLVKQKSDYRLSKKRETTSLSEKNKVGDKSDDPIRMYLREMGGVELLSREGEIAIAKRIEAGKNVMTNGLFQSPITAKKVFEWKEALEKNELLVREIIDIDSTYIESEDEALTLKKTKLKENIAVNERDYGDLTGLNKQETAEKYGKEQVHIWRRSYDVNPPGGESLKSVVERVKPYFENTMKKDLEDEKNILLSAHGNSLRALFLILNIYTTKTISTAEIPTGKPFIIEYESNKITNKYFL